MSLKQHLEKKVKETLKASEQKYAEELQSLEESLKSQLTSLERDYKTSVENEVNLRIAQQKFALEKEKKFKIEKLQNDQMVNLYQEIFEKTFQDSEFLTKFVDAFLKEVNKVKADKESKIIAYGKHAHLLENAAKKKTDLTIEVQPQSVSSGIRCVTPEIEIDYSLDQIMEKSKELTLYEVSVVLFS